MIYEPAEDSHLLSDALKKRLSELLNKNSFLKFLEMGCGSGINLQTALYAGVKKENITGCDINHEAVKHCLKKRFNCFKSDLFSRVKGKFEVIVFNPPYLPEDEREPEESRRETTGGKKGNEIIMRFLKQAKRYLSSEGKIFLVTSSLAEEVPFEELGYKAKKILGKKLFFEELMVWEISLVQ